MTATKPASASLIGRVRVLEAIIVSLMPVPVRPLARYSQIRDSGSPHTIPGVDLCRLFPSPHACQCILPVLGLAPCFFAILHKPLMRFVGHSLEKTEAKWMILKPSN